MAAAAGALGTAHSKRALLLGASTDWRERRESQGVGIGIGIGNEINSK